MDITDILLTVGLVAGVGLVIYVFYKLLTGGLKAMLKNDD
mgnify:CR=1 FL=1